MVYPHGNAINVSFQYYTNCCPEFCHDTLAGTMGFYSYVAAATGLLPDNLYSLGDMGREIRGDEEVL